MAKEVDKSRKVPAILIDKETGELKVVTIEVGPVQAYNTREEFERLVEWAEAIKAKEEADS